MRAYCVRQRGVLEFSRFIRAKYTTGEITQQIFFPRRSKPILDRIDDLLGSIYGLTREQVDYVKAYDGKFRMDED